MNIDCCKSYVGKQIIGLLPSESVESCLYYLVINSQDLGAFNWSGWTIDGTDVYSSGYFWYNNSAGAQSIIISYIGTQPTTVTLDDGFGNLYPFDVREITIYGGTCENVCYQARFPYGYTLYYIDYFQLGNATPTAFAPITIDNETVLQDYINDLLGTVDADVTSVWDGSNYVVTINNAYNLGGLVFDDGFGNLTTFDVLPCEITPPAPEPLDLLSAYPGATAGYSVRKLSTTYSGAAIRVRRSSDNTESDIGFDSNGDLDESALTAFVGSNNGFITKWYDQGGSGRDFAQTTAGNQPRIVSSGTIDKANNIPSLFFGLSNNINMSVSAANQAAFSFTDTYSIYICAKPANRTGDQTIFGKGTNLFAQTGYYISIRETTSNTAYLVINNSSSSPNYNVLYSNTSINLGCYGFNLSAGNGKASFNGTIDNTYTGLISARTNSLNPVIGVYGSGASSAAFDGWFSELIVYPTDQSANRVGIETNIKNYFTI